MADQIGELDIRGENIERAVKGFMNKLYRLSQILKVEGSNDVTESYFRETNTPLAAGGNRNINDVARGSLPPEVHPSWTKVSTVNRKFMAQVTIFYEDLKTNVFNTQARALFRVAESVVNAKDLYIYTSLTAATSTSGVVAAADDWNSVTIANRDVMGDILIGEGAMSTNFYDPKGEGWLLLRPVDMASLLRNDLIINNPSFKTADVVTNGRVGQIASLILLESTNVSADECIIVHRRAAAWKAVDPLKAGVVDNDPGVALKVRAYEYGHIQITDPQGLYTITNIDVNA